MVTNEDEGKGLVKTTWDKIRHRVAKVDPTFAKIVDKISPDKTFPIYLAYYPYGEIICDTEYNYLPKMGGGTYNLLDPDAPKEVVKHLVYGTNGIPFGMVLDKTIEYFVDFKDALISVPWLFYSSGTFFPSSKILGEKNKRKYYTTKALITVSGARSVFMLPNIGCAIHHANLQRDFNIHLPPPKSLYDHWNIFKALVNSNSIDSPWSSCLLYFSEKWVEKLYTDKAWIELKLYLHDLAWERTEYIRNKIFYDIEFSLIQKKRNLKPNPYLTDTSKQLFTIGLGTMAGYIPATHNGVLPMDILQKIYIEYYGMKKYIPTILHPAIYNFEEDKFPIYYSLQYPAIHAFSPKSRKIINTLVELRELEHITNVFKEELSKNYSLCSDTILGALAKNIQFQYFHSQQDSHHIIKPSTEILNLDSRFKTTSIVIPTQEASFCYDARFLRGCVCISTKKSEK